MGVPPLFFLRKKSFNTWRLFIDPNSVLKNDEKMKGKPVIDLCWFSTEKNEFVCKGCIFCLSRPQGNATTNYKLKQSV